MGKMYSVVWLYLKCLKRRTNNKQNLDKKINEIKQKNDEWKNDKKIYKKKELWFMNINVNVKLSPSPPTKYVKFLISEEYCMCTYIIIIII